MTTPYGSWRVHGNAAANIITVGFTGFSARVRARGGNDTVFGSNRHDVLAGGSGFDRLHSTPGRDRVTGFEQIL